MSRNHPQIHFSNFFLLSKKKTPIRQCTSRTSGDSEDTKPLFDLLQMCLSTPTEKVCVYPFMPLSLHLLFISESISGVYIVIPFYPSKDCPANSKQKSVITVPHLMGKLLLWKKKQKLAQ